ncbi:uncharacterized protein LOC120142261 [Hibiscus syriacus]|uniref:uncharacterized protein LOC120142261 n=1 Tax=Hibiscus syriacus TaxID=106335 RepID=UPI001924DB6C|nr:uncharacterized protein LOC120142261 [Hibiscus syriacus]
MVKKRKTKIMMMRRWKRRLKMLKIRWFGGQPNLLLYRCRNPVASLECSGEDGGGFVLKRMRENQSFCSDDEIGCSSSLAGSGGWSNGEASSIGSSRLLKQPRLAEVNEPARNEEDGSRSTAVVCYLKRLQKNIITNDDDASATVTGTCRLSRDQSR